MNNPIERYAQMQASLSLAGFELSPSEVHGTIVGAVANHMKSGHAPDLAALIDPSGGISEGHPLHALLHELYRQEGAILLESDTSFELLLPDEDEALELRVEGLTDWVKGYLLGLLYNDSFSVDQIPESGAEIVRDMMQIAEAGSGFDTEKEEDWALAELHEYIKVGAQLIFEFIYAERASDAPSQQQ